MKKKHTGRVPHSSRGSLKSTLIKSDSISDRIADDLNAVELEMRVQTGREPTVEQRAYFVETVKAAEQRVSNSPLRNARFLRPGE